MKKKAIRQTGFTLIELMVTVSIAAVLMMVAVPSLSTYRRNAELTSVTNTLVASINTARGEALKRGLSAMVVPTNNGTLWTAGWTVFIDVDGTRKYEVASDTLVFTQSPAEDYIAIEGNNTAGTTTPQIRFDASGYPKAQGSTLPNFTLVIRRTDGGAAADFSERRLIVVARTGRTRVCKPVSATDPLCNTGLNE